MIRCNKCNEFLDLLEISDHCNNMCGNNNDKKTLNLNENKNTPICNLINNKHNNNQNRKFP